MKILSGKYSKKSINVVGRTRPPLARMRQSIFDIVELQDAVVLDLCAGSGSFGLEALSRGAKFVYFMEENLETAQNLLSTLDLWKADNAKVIVKNVKYLPVAKVKVDLIFFDPPFGHDYIEYMQNRIVEKGWAHNKTQMMIRYNEEIQKSNEHWKLSKMNHIGKSFMHYYAREEI